MRVTSKGQVTIPIEMREKYGLLPHTEIEFVDDGKSLKIVRAKSGRRPGKGRGDLLVERLRGTATANLDMTVDEILAIMRGE
jgi:AbrB family looped-hinge helix DNA binding protein